MELKTMILIILLLYITKNDTINNYTVNKFFKI